MYKQNIYAGQWDRSVTCSLHVAWVSEKKESFISFILSSSEIGKVEPKMEVNTLLFSSEFSNSHEQQTSLIILSLLKSFLGNY